MKYWAALAILATMGGASLRSTLQPPPARSIRLSPQPQPASAEARGRLVYRNYGCTLCHGDDGKGGLANPNAETDGRVPAVAFVAEGYTPGELAKLIRTGTPRIGRAEANGATPPYRMPGWGGRMTDDEISDLVKYLVSLMPADAKRSWR